MDNINKRSLTVADVIVKELVKAGVTTAYGIVSIHNMPIYDAILREGSIKLVNARGESGAVNMADGHARSTGELGVVITSTGTGAGNAAGSLVEAWSAGVPLLHITGQVESHHIGTGRGYIHECKNQLLMMDGACKSAYDLKVPNQIGSLMRKSIKEAFTAPSGPVSIEIPIDYQSTIVKNTVLIDQFIDENEINYNYHINHDVVNQITKAKRPVIWIGNGSLLSNASNEVRKLAELTGALVISSQSAKGVVSENYLYNIGHFGANPLTKEFIEKSDLLISIGVRFRSNETSGWSVTVPDNHINIDADYLAVNRNYPTTFSLVGDIKKIVDGINISLTSANHLGTSDDYRAEIVQLKDELHSNLRKTLGPYEQILDSMRTHLKENVIFVRDVTVPANVWGSRLFEINEPRQSIHASGGGIGQALPTAIGAQIANKDKRVVMLAGDGGFMVNIGELATAAEEEIPLIILVFDDSGYGVLRNIQEAAYGRQVAVDLMSPDFKLLGESMNIKSTRIKSTDEFEEALKDAVNENAIHMIVVDMDKVGPMAEKFSGPPGVASSFKPKKQEVNV